jgi:hypothetical protein
VGIEHQTSIPRTPEQNGVVERRNRTLLEAARMMLIKAQLPDYLWAEAISTAGYTQNRCMITKCHHKTPYQIVHKRKPNINYFHVFGALCHPVNVRDDLGKLKAKADIGVFIGYCENSKGFRIWNRHTREIQETIHANFDELTQMAYEQNSLGPTSNRLNFPESSAEPLSRSRKEVETMFAPLFVDTIENRPSEVSPISAANLDHNQAPDSPQKQQQMLGVMVLQLHLQQPQNKPGPTQDNQLKHPYLNQFHKPQSMIQRSSLTRLHRLNSFLTLLNCLHAIWILLTCEITINFTLRHTNGLEITS